MELAYPWRDCDGRTWLQALSLPTLPWASQFLFLMGLPNSIVEQTQVWQSIYTQATIDYEMRPKVRYWEIGINNGWHGKIVQQIVKKALLELAAQSGVEVAMELEQWVLLHFFCREFRWAMFSWKSFLTGIYWQPRAGRKPILLPVILASMIPEIKNSASYELRDEIRNNLRNVAPPPPECLNPDERSDECFEVLLISDVINQTLTLKALQKIARTIDETERKEVMAWVEVYAKARGKPLSAIEKICGEKYLQIEQPDPMLPSIFDLDMICAIE
ncbi:MAG: hypothetical protein ACM65L_01145 [Microcoleus sp.]